MAVEPAEGNETVKAADDDHNHARCAGEYCTLDPVLAVLEAQAKTDAGFHFAHKVWLACQLFTEEGPEGGRGEGCIGSKGGEKGGEGKVDNAIVAIKADISGNALKNG